MKLTIAQAADKFGVSKEAIHNRVRRGSLKSVIENGVKYIVLDEPKTSNDTEYVDKYYRYIEEENSRLKEKIERLEGETRTLRDQREQMLIDERNKIEQIYKERDEQLKSVLHVVASKFLTHSNSDAIIEEAISAEVVEPQTLCEDEVSEISLKAFLKDRGIKKERRKKLTKRFEKRAKKDARIKWVEGKIFLNPDEFDYEDLLK